nr:MAG TPA: hypothetical protein [Caudoviricetes sp.]
MVSTERLRAIACRYDTVMARALRRALGIAGAPRVRHGSGRERLRYRGVRECFRNEGRAPFERPL